MGAVESGAHPPHERQRQDEGKAGRRNLGDQGGKTHAIGGHAEAQHEKRRQRHVGAVEEKLHHECQSGPGLADEPAHQAIVGKGEGRRPDAIVEIDFAMAAEFRRAADQIEGHVAHQRCGEEKGKARGYADGKCAAQDRHQFGSIAGAGCLGRKAAG